MKRFTRLFVILAVVATIATSCYKTETVYYEDYDMVLTYYDTKFDFNTYKTFYVRDSVGMVSDYIEEGDQNWKRFYALGGPSIQIRNEVIRQMKANGYTQVMDSLQDADAAINLIATLVKVEGVISYPGYWWGYPGYWDGYYPGWGGWYGGYYPWYGGSTYYSYKTANVMIEMADGDSLRSLINYLETVPGSDPSDPAAPKMKFVWQAFVNGLQTEQGEYDMERVIEGIKQAFTQSPYLKTN
ncbi:MAG: hypothetical protein DSY76_03150 [Bacteroidetes bacterium]|nr:MAG: hypothetical protein DSY76_03150 [Bacteroidota bacterium]